MPAGVRHELSFFKLKGREFYLCQFQQLDK